MGEVHSSILITIFIIKCSAMFAIVSLFSLNYSIYYVLVCFIGSLLNSLQSKFSRQTGSLYPLLEAIKGDNSANSSS